MPGSNVLDANVFYPVVGLQTTILTVLVGWMLTEDRYLRSRMDNFMDRERKRVA